MNKMKKEIYFFVAFIGMLLFLAIRSAYITNGLPGLYLDSVNPDYMATQLLNPNDINGNWMVGQYGFPLLCQLYHGIITVFFQMIAIMITGSTSVIQLHILNSLYFVAVVIGVFQILNLAKVSKRISVSTSILLLFSPNLIAIVRSPYYVVLPGIAFTLWAAYFILKWYINIEKSHSSLLISGSLVGLACYCYFHFLFYVPAFICFIFWATKQEKDRLTTSVISWCVGFLLAMGLYVIGYFKLALWLLPWPDLYKDLAQYFLAVIYYLFTMGIYKCYACNRGGKLFKIFLICIAALAGGAYLLFVYRVAGDYIKSMMTGLNVGGYSTDYIKYLLAGSKAAGHSASIMERIKATIRFAYLALTNESGERWILGETTSIGSALPFLILIVLALWNLILSRKKTENDSPQHIVQCFFIVTCIGFIICAVPLATRMQIQHFVTFLFVEYLLLAINLDAIITKINLKDAKKWTACWLLIGFLFSFNWVNQTLLIQQIKTTGGAGRYSASINFLAEQAKENRANGEKEIYVFPEWGFFCGFNYLTNNQVPLLTHFDIQESISYANQGYVVKICCWRKDGNVDTYLNACSVAVDTNINMDGISNRSGEQDIVIIELRAKE